VAAPPAGATTLLPADYQPARQAMSLKEVFLMLGNRYEDPAIIAEVIRRHVASKHESLPRKARSAFPGRTDIPTGS